VIFEYRGKRIKNIGKKEEELQIDICIKPVLDVG